MALMKGCTTLKCLIINNALINPLVELLWQDMRPQLKIVVLDLP